MLIPFENQRTGARIVRTEQISEISAIAGTIKSITIQAQNTGSLGDFIFNVRKNGEALFSGGGRITINSANKIVSKTGLDIPVGLGDIISLHLESVGAGGILTPIYFLAHIDDGVEVEADIAAQTHAATAKTTPVNGDEIPLVDSAASNVLKKLSWQNLKATLKTYFDALYQAVLVSGTNIKTINGTSILGGGNLSISGGGASALNDLIDVAITSPSSGQVLKYDGANWTNGTDQAGTGSVNFSPDSPPDSPSAQTDEFDGASVDPKWTRFQGAYSALSIDRNTAKFEMPSASGDANNGIFQTLPAGNCTIIAKAFFGLKTIGNFSAAGIALFQDAANNPNTCDIVTLRTVFSGGTVQLIKFNQFDQYNSDLATLQNNLNDGVYYFRASRSGTTWTFSYSLRGTVWLGETSITQASMGFAPAEFGLLINNLAHGQTNVFRFDYLRYFNYAHATLAS